MVEPSAGPYDWRYESGLYDWRYESGRIAAFAETYQNGRFLKPDSRPVETPTNRAI
jgi:hypothetical protein